MQVRILLTAVATVTATVRIRRNSLTIMAKVGGSIDSVAIIIIIIITIRSIWIRICGHVTIDDSAIRHLCL